MELAICISLLSNLDLWLGHVGVYCAVEGMKNIDAKPSRDATQPLPRPFPLRFPMANHRMFIFKLGIEAGVWQLAALSVNELE